MKEVWSILLLVLGHSLAVYRVPMCQVGKVQGKGTIRICR